MKLRGRGKSFKFNKYKLNNLTKLVETVNRNIGPIAMAIALSLAEHLDESDFLMLCKRMNELCDKKGLDVVTPDIIFDAFLSFNKDMKVSKGTTKTDKGSKGIKKIESYPSKSLSDYISSMNDIERKNNNENKSGPQGLKQEKIESKEITSVDTAGKLLDNKSLNLKMTSYPSFKSKRIEVIRSPEKVFAEDTTEAFRNYFVDRYLRLKKVLLKKGLSNVVTTSNIKSVKRGDHIILLVRDKYISRGGAGIIVGEDLEGEITLIVPLDGNLALKFKHIFLDSVLAFRVSRVTNHYCIVDDIIFPDIPHIRERHHARDHVKVAVLGDLHIGSKVFLENRLKNFIRFIRGEYEDLRLKKLADEVGVVLINGDLVDGVGVYPEQKKELGIIDIYEQYKIAADYLSQIPEDKEIIILPGNHDAAGKFVPQPPVPKEIAEDLYSLNNIKMLGNPAFIRIEEVNILMYHGYGLEHVAASLGLGLDEPTRVLIEVLRSRHLMPQWGKIPIAPVIPDYLCIDEVPDILVTSHLHIADMRITAGGILLVSTGAFQGLTTWQKQLGISPTVGVVPIIDLKDYKTAILNCGSTHCNLIGSREGIK